LFNYKWITVKYYLNENDEIKEAKIPYWQHLPLINYNITNFYFLINNFLLINKNVNSSIVSSFTNSTINNYHNLGDEKKLYPLQFNFSNTETSFLTDFFYLRNSSFIKFFINNMIDVPICFKKSFSLKTKNFELPLLKFSNFLMKKGKKEKTFNIVFSAFRLFFKTLKLDKINLNNQNFSWLNLYFFTTNMFWHYETKDSINNSIKSIFNSETNIILPYNNIISDNNNKIINLSFFLKNYLYSLLSKVSPIFSYFIYSVDKNIRKYSRGKSGKYTFIWKYVAPYKRTQLAMRWIVKDIKFHQSQKFSERLLKTFDNLMLSPEKSFSWKSKIFSHNYVFKNFRKSLMSSLRTTS